MEKDWKATPGGAFQSSSKREKCLAPALEQWRFSVGQARDSLGGHSGGVPPAFGAQGAGSAGQPFVAKRYLPGSANMNIKCFTGLRFNSVATLLLLSGQARAVTQETEQLATVGPLGGIIFGLLFVGFCVVVVWMMVRQKQPDEQEKK